MKYKAVILVPHIAEFENPGDLHKHVASQARSLCANYPSVHLAQNGETTEYGPKLLVVFPASELPNQPLVFDPPPMAA